MLTTRVPVCVAVFALSAISLAGCSRKPPAAPAFPPPAVSVARPVSQPVQAYYEYNGHLDAIEMVEVKARVKGLLKDIHFTEGEEVEKGKPLFTIDPREYKTAVARADADLAKAEADISNWKAQIKLAESDLSRTTRAASTGGAAQGDVDKARAMVDVNTAQLAVAEATKESAKASQQTANIQLGYTDIKAEIGGRISRTMVTRGNLVGQDAPTTLTTIVRMDALYVYFDAPERDLIEYPRSLRGTGTPTPGVGEAVVEIGVATEEGYPHRGKIDFRENRVDPGTGTVRLRGRIPNAARLLYPGLYSRVRVLAGEPQPRLTIPEDSIMTGQEGRYVFVVGAENKVEKRTVRVGRQVWRAAAAGDTKAPPGWALVNPNPKPPPPDAKGPPPPSRVPLRSMVAIESGLKPDDLLVVSGTQGAGRLPPGAPCAPETWEIRPPAEKK
ncbi:MAG TPA: efflux RND transporter periplasmic adaptor subunit [Gemmataceae bacterium]|nr:efflux RND transporter periplasmic adaptor subunit [Gemmataceae bacterium]